MAPFGARADERRLLTFASSQMGSTGFHAINHIAAVISRYSPHRAAALATAGSAENVGLLRTGIVDFAQAFSTNWIAERPRLDAISGWDKAIPETYFDTLEPEASALEAATPEPPELPDPPRPPFQQVFSYDLWACTPIVPSDSKIEDLLDLEGHRLMPGPRDGATAIMWRALLAGAGLLDRVTWRYGSWRDGYDMLVAGEADCVPALMVSGRVSALQRRLQQRQKMRVVGIPDDCLEIARAVNPGVLGVELAEGSDGGLEGPRRVAGFSSLLAVRAGIEEETVFDVVKAVFDHTDEIRQWGGDRLDGLGLELATRHLVPEYRTHPGAAGFFKDANVWRDGLTVGEDG